jgi:hypothetical protein
MLRNQNDIYLLAVESAYGLKREARGLQLVAALLSGTNQMRSATKELFRVVAPAIVAISGAVPFAQAQLPGAPVLQNAWATPGMVVALDIAGGSAGSGSTYAGAIGWTPGNGRFQFSGGAGMQSATGTSSRGVFGARVAMPITQMMAGNLGIAGFVGIGGGAGGTKDSTRVTSVIPVGVALGYRRAIGGAGRGFSIFADPDYQFQSASKTKKGFFRVGVGVDAGITSRFGITLGLESGGTAAKGLVGPHGTTYGIGVSMKLGRP